MPGFDNVLLTGVLAREISDTIALDDPPTDVIRRIEGRLRTRVSWDDLSLYRTYL